MPLLPSATLAGKIPIDMIGMQLLFRELSCSHGVTVALPAASPVTNGCGEG